MRQPLTILLSLFLLLSTVAVHAAEVKNVSSTQVGNRVQITYDLTGDENEAEVSVTVKMGAKDYKTSELHLEGDMGKVTTGRRKTIWWNVLQDFPRGLDKDVAFDVTAGGKTFKDPSTGMEFVFVKGGCFQMGDVFGDGGIDEKPLHEVCVNDFYMGKYEVTQGQWKAVMGNNPSKFRNCGDICPVECFSWNDLFAFMRKLNSQSGKNYRLPTEAEWEYAARSGGRSEKWAGTSSESALGEYAWYNANSGSKTHPVGQKRPNKLLLYDMSGNVQELCSDWYDSLYYYRSPTDNPQGPYSGSLRVVRGGCWFYEANFVRTAYRLRDDPAYRGNILGVRLVLPVGQ